MGVRSLDRSRVDLKGDTMIEREPLLVRVFLGRDRTNWLLWVAAGFAVSGAVMMVAGG